jgi:hypothetical protein
MYLSSFLSGPLRSVEHILRPRKFLVSTEETLITKEVHIMKGGTMESEVDSEAKGLALADVGEGAVSH